MKIRIQQRETTNWEGFDEVTQIVRFVVVEGVKIEIPESIADQELQIQWQFQHGGGFKAAGETLGYLVRAGQAENRVDIGINRYSGKRCRIVGDFLKIED